MIHSKSNKNNLEYMCNARLNFYFLSICVIFMPEIFIQVQMHSHLRIIAFNKHTLKNINFSKQWTWKISQIPSGKHDLF